MLEPEQLAALRRREEETGAAIGEQIRRAIDQWLSGKSDVRKTASRPRGKRERKA
jgi:hypothetical protein